MSDTILPEQLHKIPAHPLEFSCQSHIKREIDVYIKEPDNGVNENTGIFLIIHGAGGYAENPFFIKLREEWSNRYNVIAVGVNFLGTKARISVLGHVSVDPKTTERLMNKLTQEQKAQLMSSGNVDFYKIMSFFPGQDMAHEIQVTNLDSEDKYQKTDYCDYGYIQTMDCLYAVKYAMNLFNEKNIDTSRIYAFGSSLGGYLAQMCGKFSPGTFRLIADNSGFVQISKLEIFPKMYKAYTRTVLPNGAIYGAFKDHFYSNDRKDDFYFSDDMFRIRSLNDSTHLKIVKQHSSCKILMFHSKNDPLIAVTEKEELHRSYSDCGIDSELYLFGKDDIDGVIIKSDKHAMDADLKRLFEKYCEQFVLQNSPMKLTGEYITDFEAKSTITFPCRNGTYKIDFRSDYPTISYQKFGKKDKSGMKKKR